MLDLLTAQNNFPVRAEISFTGFMDSRNEVAEVRRVDDRSQVGGIVPAEMVVKQKGTHRSA